MLARLLGAIAVALKGFKMFSFSDAQGVFLRVCHRIRGVFFYPHWMVGIVDQPIENAPRWTELPPVRWVEPFNKTRTLAVPFAWPGSVDTFLCENFDIKAHQSRLAAVKLDANGIAAEVNLDMPLPAPLFFPFLFMRDGIVYAMPESGASRRLEIFRWQEHDGTWAPHAVVFEDKPVAGAILFEKDGWFWIAYTDLTQTPRDNLNLIYASRLAGPWRHHAANPLQTGRESSRNGGAIFESKGKLYRPAQDCSAVSGGSLRIMEIVVCTPLAYKEREVTQILPSSPVYADGFHTLTAWEDRCLVDGMRLTFSLRHAWNRLGHRFRR